MKKLIAAALFTMTAAVATSQGSAGTADAATANNNCYPVYAACTAECLEMPGPGRGACLRMCRAEYEECQGQ